MRWRISLEVYWPEIECTKRSRNIVSDTLKRLIKQGNIVYDVDALIPFVPVDDIIFPVQLKEIQSKQKRIEI